MKKKRSTTWKKRERQVAKAFGVKRNIERGSNFGVIGPDTTPHPYFTIEVKERAALPPLFVKAIEQAKGYEKGKVPIVVACQKKSPIDNAIVGIRLKDFLDLWESTDAFKRTLDKD